MNKEEKSIVDLMRKEQNKILDLAREYRDSHLKARERINSELEDCTKMLRSINRLHELREKREETN